MPPDWDELVSRPVRVLRSGAPRAGIPELVIVPGLGALGYLLPTVRACSEWTRVHLLDVPGFGHRRTRRCSATLTDVAGTVAEWLATTEAQRIALLGHSTGAQAALRATLTVPRRLETLILAGPTFPPVARHWWPLIARVARTLPHESFAEIRATMPEYLRGRRRVLTFLRTAMSDAPEHLVGDVPSPVVVMRGQHDAVADAAWAHRLAATACRGAVITVPGAHNFTFTHPHAAADALRAALTG